MRATYLPPATIEVSDFVLESGLGELEDFAASLTGELEDFRATLTGEGNDSKLAAQSTFDAKLTAENKQQNTLSHH